MAEGISKNRIQEYQKKIDKVKKEIAKVVVGQEEVINGTAVATTTTDTTTTTTTTSR